MAAERERVLSGMRPTGKLHLGNYMGALYNWVKLQDEYECYFFIADWHALTTDYADPSRLKQNVFEMALDFLAAGLDPEKCSIFIQSHVPEHAELNLLLGMLTPVSWLERVPTYKDQQEQLREKDLATYGFLGYPLLQSADILLYRPRYVPVGQDQVAHIEITREIARRLNGFYTREGTEPLLPEPEALLTPSPKLPGTDGRKMSKSYGNSILLTDPPPVLLQKTHGMSNGGQRPTQDVPGDPEICPVGDLHRVFSLHETDSYIRHGCRTAAIGCEDCKYLLGEGIAATLEPMRFRRAALEREPGKVWSALETGRQKALIRAVETMDKLRQVTGLSRDRSGINKSDLPALDGAKQRHALAIFGDWTGLPTQLLEKTIREQWHAKALPPDVFLRKQTDDLWLTRSNQRALVVAAGRAAKSPSWSFYTKPKSYEFLILLCMDEIRELHDFIVPQKLYVAAWTIAKKTAGKQELLFSVQQFDDRYMLVIGLESLIDITETEGSYGIIGS